MINGGGNADLCCIYKGPMVLLQSLHTIAIKLMILFLRTAQPSSTYNTNWAVLLANGNRPTS